MYQKTSQNWTKHMDFIMLDLLCLHLSFLAAYIIRHGFSNPYDDKIYMSLLLCVTLVNLVLTTAMNSFKNVLKRGYHIEIVATLRQDAIVVASAVMFLFVLKESSNVSRTVLFLMGIIYPVVSYLTRMVWKTFLKKRLSNTWTRSLLLVSTLDKAEAVVNQIKSRPTEPYRLKGLILLNQSVGLADDTLGMSLDEIPAMIEGVPVVATPENAAEYICREWVDEILFSATRLEDYSGELLNQFMEMGVTVHLCMPDSFNPYDQKQFAGRLCGMNVLTSSIRWVDGFTVMMKRLMDIIIGLLGSLITLFLAAFIGPAIYFSSPGPIFFQQVRVGKNGKKFKMYKFRSMYLDAEERKAELLDENNVKDGMMFKLDYDPRIIGCKKRSDGTIKKGMGNFIRDWSLDEFPQFINVLQGDMSVVGTRPPTVDEWEKYELHHRQRLAIKPGITGLWQVSGRSNITDFEEVVKLDAQYIANWSIGRDIKIILQTLKAVVKRDGAK